MIINGIERDFVTHNDKYIKGFFNNFRWLSNFELAPVFYEGLTYPSTENAYQAAKCKDVSKRILFTTISPRELKKLGRSMELRPDWDNTLRLQVMYDVLVEKFKHRELRDKLISTGDRYLEETNYWKDTFFGVCDGKGENNLGKLLMKIRKEITK